MKRAIFVLIILFIVPMFAFARESNISSFTREEQSDIKKILSESKSGIPLTMDLSKSHHYRHVIRMLQRQGFTTKNASMLFKTIKGISKTHKTAPPSQKLTLLQTGTVGSWENLGAITNMGPTTQDGLTYQASGVTSVVGGSIQTTMQLVMLNGTTKQSIGATSSVSQMGEGEDLVLTAIGTMPGTSQPSDTVVGLLTYFVQPKDGGPYAQTVQLAQNIVFPQAPPKVTYPAQQAAHSANSFILVCLSRASGNQADCDLGPYEPATGTPIVQFDMEGKVDYLGVPVTPLTATNTSTQFFVWKNDGGSCLMNAQNILDNMMVNGSSILWGMSSSGTPVTPSTWRPQFAGNGGSTNPCWAVNDRIDLSFMVAPTTSTSGGYQVPAFITTLQNNQPWNTTQIKYLEFQWGCLLPGTKVTMADHSLKNVEEIVVGDSVIANPDQKPRKVFTTFYGNEHKNVYYLTDSKGHTVALTETHSVLLTDGRVVLARQLAKGQEIYTLDGIAKIESVDKRLYAGKVYNIGVENGARPDHTDNSFYAEKVMVGDSSMQEHWESYYRKKHEDIMTRLPKEWLMDYLNFKDRTEKTN